MCLTILHVTLGLTANSKPPLFPTLPAVPGRSSLTTWQVEQLNTKSTEGAALEVEVEINKKGRLDLAELGGIKINIKLGGLIILFQKFQIDIIANQVCI